MSCGVGHTTSCQESREMDWKNNENEKFWYLLGRAAACSVVRIYMYFLYALCKVANWGGQKHKETQQNRLNATSIALSHYSYNYYKYLIEDKGSYHSPSRLAAAY